MLKKKLDELTLKDNFMFCAVMADVDNCRGFLEMCLGISVGRVEVSSEKSVVFRPEYRSVQLDVYAKDADNTHYDIEMQVVQKPGLARRSRYYHSQMDMELLHCGQDYPELSDCFVIFVCDFDPFGKGRYLYTFENCCLEEGELKQEEGCRSVFLNTCVRNLEEVPAGLVNFLEFVKADLAESQRNFRDVYVTQLQDSIRLIKSSREMEDKFMTLQEVILDERAEAKVEGRAEVILELLEDLGALPDEELAEKVMNEQRPEVLRRWLKLAARATSVGQFMEEIQ